MLLVFGALQELMIGDWIIKDEPVALCACLVLFEHREGFVHAAKCLYGRNTCRIVCDAYCLSEPCLSRVDII